MFIAMKPCSFGSKHNYLIGDKIPDGVVAPDAVKRLTKMGIIVEVEVPAPITMEVKADDMTINLTQEDLQAVMDVLTANAEDAAARIKAIEGMDILFLIHAAESRKTVQAAAKARAQELAEAENATAEPETPEESEGDQ